MRRRLNAGELSKALDVSRRAVTRYVTAGCPHERKGHGKRAPLYFNLDEVKEWMRVMARTGDGGGNGVDSGEIPAEAKQDGASGELVDLIRGANLQIKKLEVEKRQRLEREASGELVPMEDVRRAWSAQVEIVKARFRTLPAHLAQRLQGKAYDDMHEILDTELRSVLRSFAREELPV